MKNILKSAVKCTAIAVSITGIIYGSLVAYETQVAASSIIDVNTTAIVMAAEVTTVAEEETVIETVEATTEVAIEEVTEEATEEVTEEETTEVVTEEETTEVVTEEETTVEVVTEEETTTEAVTEAATVAVVVETAPAPVAQTAADSTFYTNVTYKTPYETFTYANLDEAKANIHVATLSDAEGNAKGLENKNTYAAEAARVLELVNAYRAESGLGYVAYDDTIATVAMHRAAESAYADWNMTAYENGSAKRHIRPNFQKAASIFEYYGIGGAYGENFGRYQFTPEEIVSGWKASSSHNALMLGGNYTKAGVGVAVDSEGYFYWIFILM